MRERPLGNGYLDALELLEVGVTGGCHGLLECPDDVRLAVGDGGRTEQHLLEWSDLTNIDPESARQISVVCFATPCLLYTSDAADE